MILEPKANIYSCESLVWNPVGDICHFFRSLSRGQVQVGSLNKLNCIPRPQQGGLATPHNHSVGASLNHYSHSIKTIQHWYMKGNYRSYVYPEFLSYRNLLLESYRKGGKGAREK